ncbi:hypothetical protein CEUSTIGMA_g1461.t1 [Chlamydomonas eustigma]|uniref:Uncharacterized protein n=1 Tax=Chlamydomonas eustigma TaxID=1157962 RepID=A0A250WT80_9CHLO|nr:hypothetical protein CEUSTIGMA_g1461.t1 [Chlamydomonas eustigma]|eukprot:GAX74011.1 hypothetical protein CEUSTIGMA_g1461.t1 [Chlamydomonas eustigma]
MKFRSKLWEHFKSIVKEEGSTSGLSVTAVVHVHGEANCITHKDIVLKAELCAERIHATILPDNSSQVVDTLRLGASHSPKPALVGLLGAQSISHVISILATLAAGAAFVPLDAGWPLRRLQQIVSCAGIDLIVLTGNSDDTTSKTKEQLVLSLPCPVICYHELQGHVGRANEGVAPNSHVCAISPRFIQASNDLDATMDSPSVRPSCSDLGPASLPIPLLHPPVAEAPFLPWCYIMYTSGSTGQPLGVLGTEDGILNRCYWMHKQELISAGDRVAVRTPISFVDSLWEIFGPLLLPTSSVILPSSITLSPLVMIETCQWHCITHLVLVPSLAQLVVHALVDQMRCNQGGHLHSHPLGSLKILALSGEPLTWKLAAALRRTLPTTCRLLNLYGSTEVAADCTYFEVRDQHISAWLSSLAAPSAILCESASPLERMTMADDTSAVAQASVHKISNSSGKWSSRPSLFVPAGKPIQGFRIIILPVNTGVDEEVGEESAACNRMINVKDADLEVMQRAHGGSDAIALGSVVGEVGVIGVGIADGYFDKGEADHLDHVEHLPGSVGADRTDTAHELYASVKAQQKRFVVMSPEWEGYPCLSSYHKAAEQEGGAVDFRKQRLCFRTGDLGYITSSGDLQLLGRADHQVKVAGGVRVSLEEVEACLLLHTWVKEAAVRVWQVPFSGTLLGLDAERAPAGPMAESITKDSSRVNIVAYVVGKEDTVALSSEEEASGAPASPSQIATCLKAWLAMHLPSAAVPTDVIQLVTLPRTTSGKVMRSQLPPPNWLSSSNPSVLGGEVAESVLGGEVAESVLGGEVAESVSAHSHVFNNNQHGASKLPNTSHLCDSLSKLSDGPSESAVIIIFVTVLGRNDIEPTDNFFTFGGTSLLAAQVAVQLGVEPGLVYAAPTARKLAALLQGQQQDIWTGVRRLRPVVPPARQEEEEEQQESQSRKRGRVMPAVLPHLEDITKFSFTGPGGLDAIVEFRQRMKLSTLLRCCTHLVCVTGGSKISEVRNSSGNCHQLEVVGTTPAEAIHQGAGETKPTDVIPQGAGENTPTDAIPQRAGKNTPGSDVAVCLMADQISGAVLGPLSVTLQSQSCYDQSISPSLPGAHLSTSSTRMTLAWRHHLGRCIDASPLILCLSSESTSWPLSKEGSSCKYAAALCKNSESFLSHMMVAVACSHDGSVACIDCQSGIMLWKTQLPGRAEAGMCLCMTAGNATPIKDDTASTSRETPSTTISEERDAVTPACTAVSEEGRPCIAVACGDGCLYFLDLEDGSNMGGSQPVVGGMRAAPAADPWPGCGLVWVTTHGKELLALSVPRGLVVARYPLPAASSSTVAFYPGPAIISSIAPHLIRDHCHMVIVTALDGSVHAVEVDILKLSQIRMEDFMLHSTMQTGESTSADCSALQLRAAWTAQPSRESTSAAIFSSALIVGERRAFKYHCCDFGM